MSDGGYLTLKQAAVLLGLPTGKFAMRRFKKLLKAKQEATGVAILLPNTPADGQRTHFRVTESALREHCPELFSKRDMVLRAIEESKRETDDAIDGLRVRVVNLERATGLIKTS